MAQAPADALRERIATMPATVDLVGALGRPGVSLIAECKRASPSRGALNTGLNSSELAVTYAGAGAAAISVLTEPHYFRGSADDLIAARRALDSAGLRRPVLRKDFIIAPYQLLEARAWGADAVLLIAAVLDDRMLARLMDEAVSLGLTPLVEVHDREELQRVLALGAGVVGINNRNLRDFRVDLNTTRELRTCVSGGVIVVSESGIRGPEDVAELGRMAVDAALVGEALVTADDPAAALRAMVEAGR